MGSKQRMSEMSANRRNDFEEDVVDESVEDGLSEMERVKRAMAAEKMKAQEYSEKQIVRKVESKPSNKLS